MTTKNAETFGQWVQLTHYNKISSILAVLDSRKCLTYISELTAVLPTEPTILEGKKILKC